MLPKCFAFFEAKIGGLSITYILHVKFCQNCLALLKPKSEDFLSLTRHEMLPLFCLFWTIIVGLSISWYIWSFVHSFCLFWRQTLRSSYPLLHNHYVLPTFFAFFDAKIRGLETHDFLILCSNFMPFLEPKVEDFLSLTYYRSGFPRRVSVLHVGLVTNDGVKFDFLQILL